MTTVVYPLIIATLLTALLLPVQARLQRLRLPRAVAALVTLSVAVVVLGGVLVAVVDRATSQAPELGHQIDRLVPHVQHWLRRGPLHVASPTVNHLAASVTRLLGKNSSGIASAALSTGKAAIDLVAGIVLAVFITIFLLYDGEGVWQFLLRAVPRAGRERGDAAGRAAWATVSHYVRGTLILAAFHGAAIALTLALLGVPLVVPLAVVVALGSFVPLVGAVVAGVVAVGVAGLTQGLGAALLVIVVLIADSLIEAHLLQPFVVGRYVRIHPLGIVLALATGAILFGIMGALVAVPVAASVNSGVRALVGTPEPPEPMDPARVPPEPPTPSTAGARTGHAREEATVPGDPT
ncbi:AI-2E family transporter [Acidimicrobiaceae bacterium USS-CC1]|uniref:AI-2E family transporter n=1 Tax=Acidiferrimicrobium australe TaxID=2664430 RepID=A0ABW9QPP8_9ACTN|nr:AI-2E family transporter [Acidiferrimicrobium australe]